MKINISTSNDKQRFIIRPIDFTLNSLRGIKSYIKTINNGFEEEGALIVPIEDSDTTVIYSKIKELFSNVFNCELETDETSESIIEEAENESEKFALFAQKAKDIRDNNIEKNDLKDFINVISGHGFKRELMSFQLLAAYHLAFSQNACNFSVPGAGKTTTVLAAYEYLRQSGDINRRVDKLLVIGPLAAFIAWKSDYKECFGYEPNVLEIRGGISRKQVEDRLLRSNIKEDIIIASYGSINNKKDIIQKFLKNNRVMVVLDEAHRIKNVEDGIQSNAALSLSKHAKSRVILTGTPAANSYVDLCNLYKFIWPAHDIIGYSVTQLSTMSKIPNDPRVPDLINRISSFFIRIKKEDLGLPAPVFNEPEVIPMSTNQRTIYDAISDMAVSTFENNSASAIFKQSALIRLRQAATNPNLLNKPLDDYYDNLEGDFFRKTPLNNSINVSDNILKMIREYKTVEVPNKFIAAKELASHIIGQNGKLLIWCEFVGTCQDLSDYLEKSGVHNAILFGQTPQEERETIIEQFHDPNSEFKVVIANPHAVGESISLHKACHNALYIEQSYNAGTYMQSKDRIHRVGLKPADETNYFFFQSQDSVDSVIYERVNAKEKRMLEIIEKEEIPLLANNADFQEDTEDDIKAIIREYYEYRKRNI